ncbi:pentapeptide repeat-containing protein [Halomicrococcus sp. SG-WS-1]|uniref:pentapeptide repeat-containing protein n=1 Tax=Halomicrococcus sp. SG-WS-1 TaxID=3439057 RepID=UPI003F795593
MPEERCGYTNEASTLPDVGGVCCWRPVWDETDRCVWHADVSQKPADALTAATGRRFDGAVFRGVSLNDAEWFSGRTFVDARFVDCNLRNADFTGADLRGSRIRETDAQWATFCDANLEAAEFDRSDLRFASLQRSRLHHIVFANARVNEETSFGERVVYESELAAVDDADDRSERFEAARWTYRELQRVAERNGLTRSMRRYYLREKEMHRRLLWESRAYLKAVAEEGWRWTTAYGSSPYRVIATSLVVVVLCAILYPLTGGIQETAGGFAITYEVENPGTTPGSFLSLVFFKSLYFSTITFATLGYGDIQPIGEWARVVAGVEALLGHMLLALLMFVLTRTIVRSN